MIMQEYLIIWPGHGLFDEKPTSSYTLYLWTLGRYMVWFEGTDLYRLW